MGTIIGHLKMGLVFGFAGQRWKSHQISPQRCYDNNSRCEFDDDQSNLRTLECINQLGPNNGQIWLKPQDHWCISDIPISIWEVFGCQTIALVCKRWTFDSVQKSQQISPTTENGHLMWRVILGPSRWPTLTTIGIFIIIIIIGVTSIGAAARAG